MTTEKTNLDHAAEIIAGVFRPLMKGYADALGRDLATKLRDAGLLVPDDTSAPAAPVLPEGWQLAEHPVHGRVLVPNSTPKMDGCVYGIFPSDTDITGFDWHPYEPNELTYLGDTAVATLPGKWKPAEHRRYGRVVVTNPATSGDGYVYCVFPTGRDGTGFDWHPYDPVALTYLDTEVHR